MEHFLSATTVVIPIIFVLAYGFFAGKYKAFKETDAISTINKLVLTFALPPALFVGTISVTRTQLEHDLILFVVLLLALLIAYFAGLFIAKYIFKRNLIESSIAGLAVSFAAGPFYGPALLEGLYSSQSTVAVSMISLVINVVIVPLATILIRLDLAHQQKNQTSFWPMLGQSIYQATIKTPFVWAPLLAFIFVFTGITIPDVAGQSLTLIGKATAGVAVFVAGMTIAANAFKFTGEILLLSLLKNIAVPALFFGVALALGMQLSSDIFKEGLLLAALPSGPMIVLLATKYKQYQQEASSILAITTIGMLITVSALVAFVS